MDDKKNPFIDKEINEMMNLQFEVTKLQDCLGESDDTNTLIEYNHLLYALVEKQHVIYTRMKYSSDPEIMAIKSGIEAVTLMTGREANEPMDVFFSEMKEEIKDFLGHLTGESLELDDFPFDPTL